MSDFEREDRYYVVKIKDAMEALDTFDRKEFSKLLKKIEDFRSNKGKPPLECVVIESDWQCYEEAWELVEGEYNHDKWYEEVNKEGGDA